MDKLKTMYPKDYSKIETTYQNHIRNIKPEKKQPIPDPEKYLTNTLKVWMKKKKK